jgi:hypothetical protein
MKSKRPLRFGRGASSRRDPPTPDARVPVAGEPDWAGASADLAALNLAAADRKAGPAPSPAPDAAPPPPPAEALDLGPFDLQSAEPLGAVAPSDPRLVRNQDHSAALPLLNSSAVMDETIGQPHALPIILIAAVLSVLWALAPVMFAWGYRREVLPFQNDMFAALVFVALALGPMGLVWVAAYLVHQGRRLAAETRRAAALADSLMQPAALAARGAGGAVEQIRLEIGNAAAVAERARAELLNLREVLALETERLVEATRGSSRTATHLTETLGGERERMREIARILDTQAGNITDAILRQGKMVAEASDLAQTQIRESEAALAARAADLAAAAGDAGDAARVASEDLSRQVARLETAGLGVGDQARLVEETLTLQRAALVAAAHDMRADNEALAAESETRLAQLREMIVHAHAGASEISDRALSGSDALRHLIAQATDQLRLMADAAAQERDLLSAAAAQSLGAVAEMAGREREAMERQTRQAIDDLAAAADEAAASAARSMSAVAEIAGRERDTIEHQVRQAIEALVAAAEQAALTAGRQADLARQKVDQLGEAAFSAGQKADAIFEARLNEARGLIEQSAQMISEAGARSNARLEEGLNGTRAALAQMEGLLGSLEQRLQDLPAEAESRAETVRQSIERSMEGLMASARKAADETQSIDAAFQERVRRNYEMLSEAVRLMGVVAGAAGTPGAGRAAASSPAAPPPSVNGAAPMAASATPQERRPETSRPALTPQPLHRPPERPPERGLERPIERPAASAPAEGEFDPGLRPRLRLTPTPSDEALKTVFDPPQTKPAETIGDSWTWRELLSSMDSEPQVDDAALGDKLMAEIEIMGIDAGALLPRARIEEIADALELGDTGAGRQIVRRLAPAAIRRLARRMMSDRAFRGQADRFARRFQGQVTEAARQRDGAYTLLGSGQGRAFLLVDAANSEVS